MTETVPADIAAAIEAFRCAARDEAKYPDGVNISATVAARQALNAAILAHLRNADEMKAALECIEQGV